MKKSIFIIIVLLLFLLVSFKLTTNAKNNNEQWEKINKYIYIDKSSIKKDKYSISAWFKIYSSPENRFDKINGIDVYYEITEYDAGCDIGALFYMHTKTYDKNNNLLSDEINNHNVGADCDAYVNGEIICKALCGK